MLPGALTTCAHAHRAAVGALALVQHDVVQRHVPACQRAGDRVQYLPSAPASDSHASTGIEEEEADQRQGQAVAPVDATR